MDIVDVTCEQKEQVFFANTMKSSVSDVPTNDNDDQAMSNTKNVFLT